MTNPTEARDTAPKRGTGSTATTYGPAVRDVTGESVYGIPSDGTGVRWDADCEDETRGNATGADGEVVGVQTAASTTAARVDRITGEYVGTARAFVSGLQGTSGIVDVVSSVMTVRHFPGRDPRVTYRIGVTGPFLELTAGLAARRDDRPEQPHPARDHRVRGAVPRDQLRPATRATPWSSGETAPSRLP